MHPSVNRVWTKDYYLGSKMPYIFRPYPNTKPPSGYEPFYINYLGRHGARYFVPSKDVAWIYDVLQYAHQNQYLSMRGLELLSKIINLLELEEKSGEDIWYSGRKMIEGIASRIYENYPQIFGKKLIGISTSIPRAKQTMEYFFVELSKYTDANQFCQSSYGEQDPILRFYELNEAYLEHQTSGTWNKEWKQYCFHHDTSMNVLNKIFRYNFLKNYNVSMEDRQRFVTTIFQIYANQIEIDGMISLDYFFASKDKNSCWENENLRQYLKMGLGKKGNQLSANISFLLLEDFLSTSKNAIEKNDSSGNFRFAHANTMVSFANLLKVKGCSEQTNQLEQVAHIWRDYEVIPLGANLQWVFYRSKRKDQPVLVKMLYNERELLFPFESDLAPYYDWQQVKRYCEGILNQINIDKSLSKEEQIRLYQCR